MRGLRDEETDLRPPRAARRPSPAVLTSSSASMARSGSSSKPFPHWYSGRLRGCGGNTSSARPPPTGEGSHRWVHVNEMAMEHSEQ